VMVPPVRSALGEDLRDDVEEAFARYHDRLLPVVDRSDRLPGVIRYDDIMTGAVARARGRHFLARTPAREGIMLLPKSHARSGPDRGY